MAKSTKGGLGRGLNSLLGGYEAAPQPSPAQSETKAPETALKPSAPEREVIREEDLPQEDRETLNTDKKSYKKETSRPAPKPATEPLGAKIAAQEIVAKEEYIEDNDGVTIKAVKDRPAGQPRKQKPVDNKEKPTAEGGSQEETAALLEVSIDAVTPNPNQPRMRFNKEELEELSQSIKQNGLLQPILVREMGEGYEIIAGERRWQACKLAGLKNVPVRVKDADDMKVLELALIENLQRTDLNPIEEAYGYKRMMEKGNRTQSEVATAVSKGRSTIANALRLLDLPEDAQQLLYEEKITAGHARAILSIPSEEGRKKLTEKLMNEKLSVREAEAIARLLTGREKGAAQAKGRNPIPKLFKVVARSLGDELEARVRVRSANGKNKIEIEFKDEEDLQRLFDLIHHEG